MSPVAETDPEPDPAPDPDPDPADPEPTAITASTGRINPALAPRSVSPSRPRISITAGAEIPGFNVTDEIPVDRFAETFLQRVDQLSRSGPGITGRWHVATVRSNAYAEDRRMPKNEDDASRFVADWLSKPRNNLESLTAAVGLCAPVDVRYDLDIPYSTDRPVADALASFQAKRGGLQFARPPVLSDLDAGLDTILESVADESKAIVDIICSAFVQVNVDAISLRVRTSNWSRFYPEQFGAWWRTGLAGLARLAEGKLLDTIAAGSTAVDDVQQLGSARDVFEAHLRAATAARSRDRLDADAPMTVLAPNWLPAAFAADLHRQGAGDGTYAQGVDFFRAWYARHNLRLALYMDEEASTSQIFGSQAAGGLHNWPTQMIAYVFEPSTWLYLDGGELDLGLAIRDATLNATNKVEGFFEIFENVARIGNRSLRIRHRNFCPSGEASAPVDFNCMGS